MPSSIQTIMRTSAMIYAENQPARSCKTVKRYFTEAVIANAGNNQLSIEDIITKLQNEFELVLQEDELTSILTDERYFVRVDGNKTVPTKYYLPKNRFDSMQEKSDYNIDTAIHEYVSENPDINESSFQDLLYKYCYSLLNTNINAFKQLLERKANKITHVIDTSSFEDDDIELINGFLKWDNTSKDKALFELVNYCIDYASAVNNIDQNDVVTALKNKKLYLDNSLLYRALGINGQYRKERAKNLLKRCVDSGQQLIISSVTRKEFFDTVDYHVSTLNQSTPYGNINPAIFHKYSGSYSFYQYYHEWRHDRITYAYTSFKLHIKQEYEDLLREYHITEDFKQPFSEEEDSSIITSYTDGIKEHKRLTNMSLHVNDAKNMLWLEKARQNCDNNIRDTKYYFVTTDRKLQEWDLSHSKNQPITMLPSQWLALLLKFFSQSNNDYKSFVSFLSIPKDKSEITPDELQTILAGISEITEDFKTQDDIVSALIEIDNADLMNRQSAKAFAKDRLEESLNIKLQSEKEAHKTQLQEKELEFSNTIDDIKRNNDDLVNAIKQEFAEQKKVYNRDKLMEKKTSIEKQISDYNDKFNIASDVIKGKIGNLKRLVIVVAIIYYGVLIWSIFHFGWDIMEPFTYIVGLLPVLLSFLSSIIWGNSFNPKSLLELYECKVSSKIKEKHNINDAELDDLNEMLSSIKTQLESDSDA